MLARIASSLVLLLAAAGIAASERSFDLAIVGESPTTRFAEPRVLQVKHGDTVRVRIVSDAIGEVHLHGYRLDARTAPGKIAELNFIAKLAGRYRIEWHTGGRDASAAAHHIQPLAILDVAHP